MPAVITNNEATSNFVFMEFSSGTGGKAAQRGFGRAMRLVETVFVIRVFIRVKCRSDARPQRAGDQHEQGLYQEKTPECEQQAMTVRRSDCRSGECEQVECAIGKCSDQAAVAAPAAQ